MNEPSKLTHTNMECVSPQVVVNERIKKSSFALPQLSGSIRFIRNSRKRKALSRQQQKRSRRPHQQNQQPTTKATTFLSNFSQKKFFFQGWLIYCLFCLANRRRLWRHKSRFIFCVQFFGDRRGQVGRFLPGADRPCEGRKFGTE